MSTPKLVDLKGFDLKKESTYVTKFMGDNFMFSTDSDAEVQDVWVKMHDSENMDYKEERSEFFKGFFPDGCFSSHDSMLQDDYGFSDESVQYARDILMLAKIYDVDTAFRYLKVHNPYGENLDEKYGPMLLCEKPVKSSSDVEKALSKKRDLFDEEDQTLRAEICRLRKEEEELNERIQKHRKIQDILLN